MLLSLRGGPPFLLLVTLIAALGAIELARLARLAGARPHRALAVAGSAALPVAMYLDGGPAGTAGAAVLSAVVMGALALSLRGLASGRRPLLDAAVTAWSVLYVGWLAGHLVLLGEMPRQAGRDPAEGGRWVLVALLLAWALDTGAYAVGRAMGRRKLAPRVSPGKTVEGAIGGLAATVITAFAVRGWFGDAWGVADTVVVGVAAAIFGTAGDLAESQLKRDAGVKDASNFIPGHGGVLDRFDSLLFIAPAVYYFARIAGP